MNSPKKNRIFGLDLLRSIAILLVATGHSKSLFQGIVNSFVNLPNGVDLFFVLSGYLIGLILLRILKDNKKFTFTLTLDFLIRRWFRTLPNYFLFLLINIILVYFSLIPGYINKYLITYVFFFQNFYKPYDFIFWESWSLSVEEWFYLIFPLFLSFIFLFFKTVSSQSKRQVYLIGVMFLLITPLIFRITQSSSLLDTDLYFRKLVLTRLDTIAFGLLTAFFHFYYHTLWIKYKSLFFIIGIIILTLILHVDSQNIFFEQTFRFTIIGLGIALLIPQFSLITKGGLFSTPIKFISKISYSIYLVHLPVFFIISNAKLSQTNPLVAYLSFWAITVFVSWFIYKFYELPLMNLRDKVNLKRLFHSRIDT